MNVPPTENPEPLAATPEVVATALPRDVVLDRICLAAPLLLSALLVILDDVASCRIPLRYVLPWLYLFAMAATVGWLLAFSLAPRRRSEVILLAGLAVLSIYFPMTELFGTWRPDPIHGISMGFDDWCYQSLGDYLLNNPRGRLAGMSMLDEFGAHLQDSRFSTPGLLELVGNGVPFKDPPMSHFALGALCLAVHFFSLFYLGRALLGSLAAAAAAAFLGTVGGWMGNALTLANYDNLLFLALAPALIGVLVRLEASPAFSLPLTLAGGLLLAALLETFPEGVPILGVLVLPLVLFLCWRCVRRPRLCWAVFAVLGLGGLLASPYLPVFRTFLLHQIQWAQTSTLPGAAGNFPGLLDARRLPSFFALGEEWTGAAFSIFSNALPLVMLTLLAVGAWSWRRVHPWLPWVAVPLGALLLWQDGLKKFDYGTYKVLFCAAWWIYPGVVAGLITLARAMRGPVWLAGVLVAMLAAAIGGEKYEHRSARGPLPTSYMEPLRELTNVRFVTQGQPLLLDFDGFEYPWAVYYLRHLPITTFKQQGALAMPHLASFLSQASSPPPQSARFVLVKGKRPDALWTNDAFSLLPLQGAYISGLDGPWGTEGGPDIPDYIWIGTQPETFRVHSLSEGNFELRATDLGAGPRAPHPHSVAFEITDPVGAQRYEWKPSSPQKFPIHLHAGENLISVRCVEPPSPAPAGGDLRETMLQIRGYSVSPGR